jgi:hypothetical protein
MQSLRLLARPALPRVGKPRRLLLNLSYALAAALACGAAPAVADPPAAAETPRAELCRADLAAAAPARWSRPDADGPAADWSAAAFRGLSCERCNPRRHYCVYNFVRYEYACAPLGTVACVSATWTGWCPAHRGCWAGRCR